MTISLASPQETPSLINSIRPTLYPVKIDPQHHQLKHRISTRTSDVIYYCSSHEIFALHLKTRRRELVKSLSWAPQCLDASHGWICAGGNKKGQCAFIRVTGDQAGRGATSRTRAEVDELLPLNLNPQARYLASQETNWTDYLASHAQRYVLHYYELGSEIVNSVTIHKIRSEKKGVEDDVILIATNNDKTVRIFSLSQFKLLASLEFSISMNHASMSPDSETLLAVGDEPQVFFYKRIRCDAMSVVGEKMYATYDWQPFAEPRLPCTPVKDACFSTSFSPTGHICAVASQSGVITIYDLARILQGVPPEQAIIYTLKTPRSSSWLELAGAVRSLNFSPAPWDLLACAEDQGQVSVIDLRDSPTSKQTLELSTENSAVLKADLGESSTALEQRQLEIERRFIDSRRAALEAQDHLVAVNNTADLVEYAVLQSRRERGNYIDGMQGRRENSDGLTESERRMIDTIGLRRTSLRENETSGSSPTVVGLPVDASGQRYMADAPYLTNSTSTSPLTAVGNGGGLQTRSTASIAEYVRQRNLERLRSTDRAHQPRRRSSIVLNSGSANNQGSNDEAQFDQNDISGTASALAPIGTTSVTLSTSPSPLSSSTASAAANATSPNPDEVNQSSSITLSQSNGDPWQTLTDAFTTTYTESLQPDPAARSRRATALGRRTHEAQSSNLSRASSTLQQLMARNERQRSQTVNNVQRLRQLQAAMADQGRGELPTTTLYEVLDPSDVQTLATNHSRDGGIPVMGVGWSADGRNLYIGTEDGILEYAVNVRQRMQWPGVSFL